MMQNLTGKKEKWKNKGTDKQYVADSLFRSTTCHSQTFVPILIILRQLVAEKSLTEDVHMHYIGVRWKI